MSRPKSDVRIETSHVAIFAPMQREPKPSHSRPTGGSLSPIRAPRLGYGFRSAAIL